MTNATPESGTFFPEPVDHDAPPVGSGAPWSDEDLTADDRRAACPATPKDSSDCEAPVQRPAASTDPSEAGSRGGDDFPPDGHPRADADTNPAQASTYTGPERRALDPDATAIVNPVGPTSETPYLQWSVRAGETILMFTSATEADDCGWLHNYMHGHLTMWPGVPVPADAPLPADRRKAREATPLDVVDLATTDAAPNHPDEVFDSVIQVGINALDTASRLEDTRGGKYRAFELYRLAREAEKVRDA